MTNITLKDITLTNVFKIHPAIGIARLGDSPTDFCLTPEKPMGLPTKCDSQGRAQLDAKGQEQPVDTFKDSQGRIKRQAARFRVYLYKDDKDPQGRELKIGDTIQMMKWQTGELFTGRVLDIEWTVYLANKKASWYQFEQLQGEHGYAADHPLRNASITDPTARQRLIIDPGPQTVSYSQSSPRRAEFAKGKNAAYPQSFPPPLTPHSIDTLGEIIVHQQNDYNRLIVLGGHGHSGSFNSGFGEPQIESFANNDGWFDDVSDGPVTANVWVQSKADNGDPLLLSVPVNDPAWVLVGSPSYVPEIENIITLDDIAYDLAVRYMDYAPEIYGPLSADELPPSSNLRATAVAQLKSWNKNYYPYFCRDIWPILRRPNAYQWVMVFDPIVGGDPHSTSPGGQGNMDPTIISIPPHEGEDPTQRKLRAEQREFVYSILRQPGQENAFRAPVTVKDKYNYQPPLMPLLFGDNPLSNTLPSKFLRLTETQLFILQQWRDGKFINEKDEGLEKPIDNPPPSGADLDQGVLWNTLGGSFCPGGEVCWIIRNPTIYAKPYRIKQAPYAPGSLSQPAVVNGADTPSDLSKGLEPGDLTKYGPLPWQSDFNECATQPIDVTYNEWVNTYPASTGDTFGNGQRPTDGAAANAGNPSKQQLVDGIFWWPAHRPMEVILPDYSTSPPRSGNQVPWTRTLPQTNAGDLEMVTAWTTLGFIRFSPDPNGNPQYLETERNDGSDNPPKSGA